MNFAREQFARLNRIFTLDLGETQTLELFLLHRRAVWRSLFRVGRRTHYWIVYTVDDEAKIVNVLSFWAASRRLLKFERRPSRSRRTGRLKKRIAVGVVYPTVMFYRIGDADIQIVRVVDGRRNLAAFSPANRDS